MKINTGDILLVSSHSWLAKKIQFFQKDKWNHAGLFLDIDGEIFVCEALEHGIALTNFKDYLNTDKELLLLKPEQVIPTDQKKKMKMFALSKCGNIPYGYMNLLVFQSFKYTSKYAIQAYNKLYKKFTGHDIKNYDELKDGIWIGRSKAKSDKRYICGEFVMRCYNYVIGYFENSWYMGAPADIDIDMHFRHTPIDNKKMLEELSKNQLPE